MAKQTFTTGQVLTAAQMTSLQQTAMGGGSATAKTASYVLVAADAGTSVIMNAAGATTITVNTGLFAAGDTLLIQNIGAGTTTVTAGTATVNTAGSLALGQYEGGILYFTATGAAIFHDYTQASGSSGFPAPTTYTPTVTATSGTATSVTATGNYSQSGKYVVLNVNINITTKGTATGAVIFTLPIAAKTGSFLSAGVCQEIAASGQMGNILCAPSISTTTAQIRRYDFATFWSDGFNPCGTLIYEVA
jgi:hypothetical protein